METKKRHIVLLTTWYPPLQGVAVNRMQAFAKYLDHAKFDLTIITLGNEKISGRANENGFAVFRIKPRKGIVHPTFKSTDSKALHYLKVAWRKALVKIGGDENNFWAKKALAVLNEVNRERKIDVLISSFSPAAPHVAALGFCKKNPVPWIVDMRDEMSLNPQSDSKTRKYYAGLEREIAKHAAALTSVSQPIVDYFKTVIPGLHSYVEIRNGFDHEMGCDEYTFTENFTLLHAGSFYGTRKPDNLMKVLVNLQAAGVLPPRWKFICAGAARNFSIPDAIRPHVEIRERVSQQESIKLMCSSDLNVLLQPPTGRKGVYTGKLFDYLSVLKPILAIVDPEDVAADLVRSTGSGYVSGFSDLQSVRANLVTAIECWKNKEPVRPDVSRIEQMHRKYQVQKLNLLIENLLHEK